MLCVENIRLFSRAPCRSTSRTNTRNVCRGELLPWRLSTCLYNRGRFYEAERIIIFRQRVAHGESLHFANGSARGDSAAPVDYFSQQRIELVRVQRKFLTPLSACLDRCCDSQRLIWKDREGASSADENVASRVNQDSHSKFIYFRCPDSGSGLPVENKSEWLALITRPITVFVRVSSRAGLQFCSVVLGA